MRLKDLCEFKTGNPDADFWLIRKGDEKKVGQPTKVYSPEYIGVKVIATDLLVPDYLYYYLTYLQNSGIFVNLSHGTTGVKNIKISDIANIPVSFT